MRKHKSKAVSFLLLIGLLFLSQVHGWAEEKAQVQLVSVSPMGGSYISSTPEFTLTFDKNVANIDVRDNNKGKIFFYDQNGNEVLSHVSIADDEIYPLQKREIELKILETLPPGTYKLVVEAGIRAKNGTETGKSYVYYYRVREEESSEESDLIEETKESETETEEQSEEESAEVSDETITEAPAESSEEAPHEEVSEPSPEEILDNNEEEKAPSKEMESQKDENKASSTAATQTSVKETPSEETKKSQPVERKEETTKDKKSKKDMVQKKARDQKEETTFASKEVKLYQLILTENTSDSHLKSAMQESKDDLPSNGHFIATTSFKLALTAFILLFFIGFCYRILHFKKELM